MFAMKPILSVSLLSAFLFAFCTAQVAKSQPTSSTASDSKQSSARSYTSGGSVDPNSYMNQVFAHKPPIDLMHLVPILLVLAFIPLVLPLIIQLFAGIFTPMNFTHGKRKRDANFHSNPQISQILLDLMTKVGESIDKYSH